MAAMDRHKPHRPRPAGEQRRRVSVCDRLLGGVLRSPLSPLVDGTLLLLTVTGRKTGRSYSLPVQYAAGPHYLWVWPGNPEQKTWWRNLLVPAAVTLRLRGAEVVGVARVIDGAVEPREAERGLLVYASRFPRTGRRIVGGELTRERLREAAAGMLLVRIEVGDRRLRATRRATVPARMGLIGVVRRRPVVP